MSKRFLIAMAAYVGLAVIAGLVLEGDFLWVTLAVLALFAVKTWLDVLRKRLDS